MQLLKHSSMLMIPFSRDLYIKKVILFITIGFLFQACMFSHSHGYHAYFCTTTPAEGKRFLYINEQKIGELPYASAAPECEQMPLANSALYTALPAGEHEVEIRDENGKIVFEEQLEVERRKNSASVSSIVEKPGWDTRVKIKDDCLVIELIY